MKCGFSKIQRLWNFGAEIGVEVSFLKFSESKSESIPFRHSSVPNFVRRWHLEIQLTEPYLERKVNIRFFGEMGRK